MRYKIYITFNGSSSWTLQGSSDSKHAAIATAKQMREQGNVRKVKVVDVSGNIVYKG